jgi:hypothetical protein
MTLHDMLNSDDFQRWEGDRLGNDLFINDPKRAARLHEYAEEGLNGSTHEEVVQDWRDYVANAELTESVKEGLLKEIESVEEWHIKNGTIEKVIG